MGSRLSLADAVARVTLKSDASSEPEVTQNEVTQLALASRTADAAGLLPSEDDYEETYDINRAVAQVYDLKATRTAGKFDLTVDNQALARSQQHAHFVQQAQLWRSKVAFTWPL